MACKCTEIANCKADIEALKTAKGYLLELTNLDSQVGSDLSSAANLCDNSFTTKNQNELEKNLKEVRDDVTSTLITIMTKLTTEISTLENQSLVALESEDKQTHQEEKKNETKA